MVAAFFIKKDIMGEPTPIPQYQIDQITSYIRQLITDNDSYVGNIIKNELNSPVAISRFEVLLDKYYKSNTELTIKIDQFHQSILKNQDEVADLLEQIISDSAVACPHNRDLALLKEWLEELLFGPDHKFMQQVRDLLESKIARNLRNMVITYMTIIFLLATISGIVGYYALTKNIIARIEQVQHVTK